MHFDDRLATVLRQRVSGDVIARIQYRQIIDLLGSEATEPTTARIDAAYARLAELGRIISSLQRAAILSEPGVRLRNPHLVAVLGSAEPDVATAAVRQARLDDEQWLDLMPALVPQAQSALRDHPDLGLELAKTLDRLGIRRRSLPSGSANDAGVSTPVPMPTKSARQSGEDASLSGIGELVRRIEAFRESRRRTADETGPSTSTSPRLPLGDVPEAAWAQARSLDFVAERDGMISWAGGDIAPMAIGLRLGASEDSSVLRMPPDAVQAYRRCLVLRNVPIEIDGAPAIAGVWRLFAYPRFDPLGGRYLGHAGRMHRPADHSEGDLAVRAARASSEGDRIRQLLHELRTPVNAIQGFAEVIQQQLFGPTPHEYRAHAAAIAADAARILGGFDELERLARLDTGAMQLAPGQCDLAELVEAITDRLAAFTGPRQSGVDCTFANRPLAIALDRSDAERLFWRLLATLVSACVPGERLAVRGELANGKVVISIRLPEGLVQAGEADLFDALAGASQAPLGAGMFGSGFALRLCRSEARAALGELVEQGGSLKLELPGLTEALDPHSLGHKGNGS